MECGADRLSNSEEPAVSVDNVTVEFSFPNGDSRLLTDCLSFAVRAGEFVVLVGKSGCGKTSLLNLIAGLLQPSSGSVQVLGLPPEEAKNQIGYMFARDALLPWRTARKNVEVGLEVRGVPKRERHEIAGNMLSMIGLGGFDDHYVWQLSQGMRQRVALARTWAISPTLLLMDEPFGALDAQTRQELQGEFLRFWEADKRTVVFVTHDLVEAMTLGDRILVMREGSIVSDIVVPFDRPRDFAVLGRDKRFRELEYELSQLLSDG